MLYTSLTTENQRVNNKNKLYGKAGGRAHTAPWHPLLAKDTEWLRLVVSYCKSVTWTKIRRFWGGRLLSVLDSLTTEILTFETMPHSESEHQGWFVGERAWTVTIKKYHLKYIKKLWLRARENRILKSMRLDLLQKGRLKDLCNPNSEGFIPFFISTGLKYRIFYLNLHTKCEERWHLSKRTSSSAFGLHFLCANFVKGMKEKKERFIVLLKQ